MNFVRAPLFCYDLKASLLEKEEKRHNLGIFVGKQAQQAKAENNGKIKDL